MKRLPNILWICTEHQRYDTIHALGNNSYIRTPNLDWLVAQGTAFTHAFCQNPVCTPSRASFLTGRYPAATRTRQNGQNIPKDEVLITRELANAGYHCGLVGKLHVSASALGPERRVDDGYEMFAWSHGPTEACGGDWLKWINENNVTLSELYQKRGLSWEVTDEKFHQTTWCVDRALQFMQEHHSVPWMISLNPWAAHDPFSYLAKYMQHYDPATLPPPICLPDEFHTKPQLQMQTYRTRAANLTTKEMQMMKAAYYATIEHLDAEFGRLFQWLKETDAFNNTLIIFTADHGEMLGDHGILHKGCYFYESAVRVPLIFSWPGVIAANRQSSALVELVDIAPTIYELLGWEIPQRMQGRSLAAILQSPNPPPEHKPGVYSEFHNSNPAFSNPLKNRIYASMWRNRRYKVVVYHGDEDTGELYDLENDPDELINRWHDPAFAEIRFDMVKRCFDARVFQMDPLPERIASF
jgi:arylsulfatase